MKNLIKTPTVIPDTIKNIEQIKKMSKLQLVDMIEKFILPMSDPEKYKELVKSSMPELVAKIEDKETMVTSMQQSATEMVYAVAETLKKYNGFTDDQVHLFLKHLQENLTVVEKIEEGGLSMLSDHSMKHIVEMVSQLGFDEVMTRIAKTRYQKETMWKSGIDQPNYLEGSKIEKQLQKPRR